jgi:two-component system response regulator HydG
MGHVLFVDDDEHTCELVQAGLATQGYDVATATSGEEALEVLRGGEFDVVMTDVRLGAMDGIQLCSRIATEWDGIPVVVVTAFGDLPLAISAIRAGAYDFVSKPFGVSEIQLIIDRAVQHKRLQQEVRRLRRVAAAPARATNLIGESPRMRSVYELIGQVAETDATVMITGESGTGKELVARAIHDQSLRAREAFVAINCAAMPASLLESELFGHVRGAFTDAKVSRTGLFVQASGGTLFLDEIGEMPVEMQAKLLRVLQERSLRPVGSDVEVKFDTRIVAATNRDLDAQVEDGRFREDLYYRINVVRIEMPPLRTRGHDILLLAQKFLDAVALRLGKSVQGVSAAAARKLLEYDWPGNVRELENTIERAVTLTRYHELTVDDLPAKVREHRATDIVISGDNPEEMPTLEEVERRYVARVLRAVRGNKTQAAHILGLDRRTLYRRLDRLRINGGEN